MFAELIHSGPEKLVPLSRQRGTVVAIKGTITNDYRLDDLNIRALLSYNSRHQKSETRVQMELVSSEACLHGTVLPCPLMVFLVSLKWWS